MERLSHDVDHQAPCKGSSVELFFSSDVNDIERAKDLCHTCPRQLVCLAEAVTTPETYGIWGGHLFREGRIVIAHHAMSYRSRKSYRNNRPHIAHDYPVPKDLLHLVSFSKKHKTNLSTKAMAFSLN